MPIIFTIRKGSEQPLAKINEDDVRQMRIEYESGKADMLTLAKRYGLTQPRVSKIVRRVAWTHVD